MKKKKPGRGKGPPLKPHTRIQILLLVAFCTLLRKAPPFLYFSRRKKKWLWSFAIKTSFFFVLFFSGSRRLEPFSYLHEEGGGGRRNTHTSYYTYFFFGFAPAPERTKKKRAWKKFFFWWCVSWVVFFFICCARFAPNVRYLNSFFLSLFLTVWNFYFFHLKIFFIISSAKFPCWYIYFFESSTCWNVKTRDFFISCEKNKKKKIRKLERKRLE